MSNLQSIQRESIFDLAQRTDWGDPFDSVEKCRQYDLDNRTSMVIPMQHMMLLLKPYCKKGARFLEVGCASGLLSLRVAGRFPDVEVYGVEQNDGFLKVIQDNLIMANLIQYPGRFAYEWGRYTNLPIEDKSVDVVFSFCSLHRWKNPTKAFKECARVCKDDGIVILYDLARDSEDGMISFILQYTGSGHEEFMKALQSSFTLDEVKIMLQELALDDWHVSKESVNLIISSKKIDTSYSVGQKSVYERIFQG